MKYCWFVVEEFKCGYNFWIVLYNVNNVCYLFKIFWLFLFMELFIWSY